MGLVSAFQRAGREGQATASQMLREESARLRQPTDKEHYADALERTTLAVESGMINADNKEAISAFTQNQYLLNKTGGQRDLGGQLGSFGIFSQLGGEDGTEKFIAAGRNPYAHTDQGTIVHGAKGGTIKGTNIEGQPIYSDTTSGSTSDEILLGKPDKLQLLKLKDDSGKDIKLNTELKYENETQKDLRSLLKMKSEDDLQGLLSLYQMRNELTDINTKLLEASGEDAIVLNKQKQDKEAAIEQLTDTTAQLEEDFGNLGYYWNEDEKKFENELSTATVVYGSDKDAKKRSIRKVETFDPDTKKYSVDFIVPELNKDGEQEDKRLTEAQMWAWAKKQTGTRDKNIIATIDNAVDESGTAIHQLMGQFEQKNAEWLDNAINEDKFITYGEAKKNLGEPLANLLFDAGKESLRKTKENIDAKVIADRVARINRMSVQDRKSHLAGFGVDLEKFAAMDSYVRNLDVMNDAMMDKGKGYADEDLDAYMKAIENRTSGLNMNVNKAVLREINTALARAAFYQDKRLNGKILVTEDNKIVTFPDGRRVETTMEEMKNKAERDAIHNYIDGLKERKFKIQ